VLAEAFMVQPLRSSFLVVAAFFVAGCGDETMRLPTPADPCDSLRSQCLENQQACVVAKDGAKCEPCAVGSYAALTGSCQPIGGTPLTHDFAEFTTMAGQEVLGVCRSWTLENPTELWVNAVELSQDEASHHSNWTFVADNYFDGPDGIWPCKDRNYSQLTAALNGGVLYAQSTQAAKEVQKFPNGAAVRIPPYSRIISDVHLLNTTSAPITGHARLSVYTLPIEEVEVKLVPFHFSYDGLAIPPHAVSRFTGHCDIAGKFQSAAQGPFDMKVYYVLPHTHALGTRFFLDVLGGPHDGQSLIDVKGFNSDARGRAYDPPVDMTGADGFSFGCEFTNPRAESVGWGFGDQEMCETLGFADATVAFESRVDAANADGMDGATQLFTGDCSTLAFAWDFNKPGGSPPP
jgi:hypothetical protein